MSGLFANLTDEQKKTAMTCVFPDEGKVLAPPVVYVDAAIHEWRGKRWAHLFSEDLDYLHEFAKRLGLLRGWFQKPPRASWPHYDVTAPKRLRALSLGAVEADRYQTVIIAYRLQGRPPPSWIDRVEEMRARAKEPQE